MIYINDIDEFIVSHILKFADDTKGVIHLSKPVSVSNLKPDSVSVCT